MTDQCICVLQAVDKGRCLQYLSTTTPPPERADSQSICTTSGALIRFGASPRIKSSSYAELVLEQEFDQTNSRRQLKKATGRFSELLNVVSHYGMHATGGEIIWEARCSNWGTPQKLQQQLIDVLDEQSPVRIHGYMDIRGGARRPFASSPVNESESGGGISLEYSKVSIDIMLQEDRLVIYISSPSANALTGCWFQVMERLGVDGHLRKIRKK